MEQTNTLKWVTAARVVGDYLLELDFNDGRRVIFDCLPLISQYKLFALLPTEFSLQCGTCLTDLWSPQLANVRSAINIITIRCTICFMLEAAQPGFQFEHHLKMVGKRLADAKAVAS